MATYTEQQNAMADAMHAVAAVYAKRFTKLSGTAWRYAGAPRTRDGHADMGFNLIREDTGATVYFHGDTRKEHVTARPSLPMIPDGSGAANGRYSFPRDYHIEPFEAGVSLDRFTADIDACARRFYKHVAEPLAAAWPTIQTRIAEAQSSFDARDKVAADLAARFDGHIREPQNGTVYVSLPAPLLSVQVTAGGYVRFSYTPSLSLAAVAGLFEALIAEASAKTLESSRSK